MKVRGALYHLTASAIQGRWNPIEWAEYSVDCTFLGWGWWALELLGRGVFSDQAPCASYVSELRMWTES